MIVPAHNEEAHIGPCVQALMVASKNLALMDEPVVTVVVLDACTDGTARIAQRAGALTVAINARNVGAARALGARMAMGLGARWLAFTDADTVVEPALIALPRCFARKVLEVLAPRRVPCRSLKLV